MATLRRVFDTSCALGASFRRYYRVDLTLVDVAELLPELGAPCHAPGFQRIGQEAVWRSDRAACGDGRLPGLCDHWRESSPGLAGALSTAACFTRVDAPAHGGSRCTDLLHLDPQTPLRFSAAGSAAQSAVDAAAKLVRSVHVGARLDVLGLTKGVLHYRIEPSRGGCALDTHTVFGRALRRRTPTLTVCNASPRPVLNESP
ncbi:MAG: hypothetical protein EXR69_04315 [Myxococcales bacterium]|nr:hypothetical protein [Myxococcales bacterium]